jgi:hypothetical protein
VYRCSPHHPPHSLPVLTTSTSTLCTGAPQVIIHIVHRCLPRRPPHRVPVLTTPSTTCIFPRCSHIVPVLPSPHAIHQYKCTRAHHVVLRIVFLCSPRHPKRSLPMLNTSTSSFTRAGGAPVAGGAGDVRPSARGEGGGGAAQALGVCRFCGAPEVGAGREVHEDMHLTDVDATNQARTSV